MTRAAGRYTKELARAVLRGLRRTLARKAPSRLRRLLWHLRARACHDRAEEKEATKKLIGEWEVDCGAPTCFVDRCGCECHAAFAAESSSSKLPPDGITFDIPEKEIGSTARRS